MDNNALSKLKSIERNIKQLKKLGYNVFCIDNERLIFESPTRRIENEKQSLEDTKHSNIGYGGSSHSFTDLEYDFEINLLI